MKRSLQEVVELVVFGLIALLIGTGVLWLAGWVFGLVGLLFKVLAGLIWWLLRFIVPVAIVAGLVYFLVRVLQGQGERRNEPAAAPVTPAPAPASAQPPASAETSGTGASAAPTAPDDAPTEGGTEEGSAPSGNAPSDEAPSAEEGAPSEEQASSDEDDRNRSG